MGHANTTGRKGLKSRISRLRRIRGTYGNMNSLICDERENMKTVCDNKAYWGINTRLTICFVTGVYSREPNTYAQTREELGLATVIWHKQTAHGFFLDNSTIIRRQVQNEYDDGYRRYVVFPWHW